MNTSTNTQIQSSGIAHTPTPWETTEIYSSAIGIVAPWSEKIKPGTASGFADYRGIHICEQEHQGDNPCVSKAQTQANMDFIVRAVNCHDELLVALKSCEETIVAIHGEPPAGNNLNEFHRELIKIRAAIAKAKGGAQ